MQSLIVDHGSLSSVNWEEDCFKYCEFRGINPEGLHITADFNACRFEDVDWYWGLFNIANFVECKFINCTFRGTVFAECRFVGCELDGCKFIKDNLNGECDFPDTTAYGCSITNTKGFGAQVR